MKKIYLVFSLVFTTIVSTACCINHNELKVLRFLEGQQSLEPIVLRHIDHLDQVDPDLLALAKKLKQERDDARELLGELADFAEDNT